MSARATLPAAKQPALKGLDLIFEMTKRDELFREVVLSRGRPFASQMVMECHKSLRQSLVPEYGEPESSLTLSAIHAAGFALNMHSLGTSVDSIRIGESRNGFYHHVHPRPFERLENPRLMIMRDAFGNSGAFGAEVYMGMWHPVSLLPTKILTAIFCHYLDKTYRKEQGHFFQRTLEYSRMAITANKHIFSLLNYKLSNTHYMSHEELNDAFKGVHRVHFDIRRKDEPRK
jgi:hypothetical protein